MSGQDSMRQLICRIHTLVNMPSGLDLLLSLGQGVAEVLNAGRPVDVTDVHILGDGAEPAPGSLVVGVTATDASSHLAAVEASAARGCAALVLRGPVEPRALELACHQELTVASLDRRMEWSHFTWFVRGSLHRDVGAPGDGVTAQQELFALADAIGHMVDGPVTIEDAQHRVLAYSASTGRADLTRTSTILGRAVPPDVVRRLRGTGVLRRLASSSRPFVVSAADPDFLQRLVIPIRVGGETVGSIWAIWQGELTPALATRLARSSAAVALHVVQLRSWEELASRYSVDRVRHALRSTERHPDGGDFVLPTRAVRVVGLERLCNASAYDDLAVWRTYFRRHSWADPILADVDGVAFAITGDHAGPGGWEWLRALAAQGGPGTVAASRATTDLSVLPARRIEAAEVLAAANRSGQRASSHEQLWAAVVYRRATSALAATDHDAINDLLAQDDAQGTQLAVTARAWLESWGDVNRVARLLHIHPNTVRLRMRKVKDLLADIDLADPDQRTAALLLLRAALPGGSGESARIGRIP
ncbi:PucR family transcriptional regulator [Streptomyces sp. NPDC052042]|uniref:PucR family transcriptional regulator n=1 Tax=Streptomyces sp. NPDC052042 TaxID=3365683 RepID=UPI0037D213EC